MHTQRRLFEVKELLIKSSKFVKIVAFSFSYGCKGDTLCLFDIGMTQTPFLYILGCLRAKQEPLAPLDFREVSKKPSKIPNFVNKSPIFVNHTKHRRLLLLSVLLRRRGASGASKRLWVK